jgi:hypothetical protein
VIGWRLSISLMKFGLWFTLASNSKMYIQAMSEESWQDAKDI